MLNDIYDSYANSKSEECNNAHEFNWYLFVMLCYDGVGRYILLSGVFS